MDRVTLDRDEWMAVARELDAAYRESAPPGLRDRIAALLDQTPASWGDEACSLELDQSAADVVRAIVRRRRRLPEDPELLRSQGEALSEAEDILHEHQQRHDDE